MSLRVSRNLGPFTTAAATLFALKEWLKTGHPGTKHWTVTRSSDGTTFGAGDNITHAGTGAGGLNNNGAWFVLRDPDSNREIEFANYGSSLTYLWYCMYSKGSLFTGGGATTRATATDEKAFHYNRTAPPGAYLAFPSSGQWYTHIVAEGDTPDGDVYPFWCLSRVYSSGLPACCIMMDCVIDSLSPADDDDKAFLLGAGEGGSNGYLTYSNYAYIGYGNSNGQLSGYMRYGEVNEEWMGFGGLYYIGSAVLMQPGSLGANPEDGKYGVLPFFVFRNGGTTPGIKGQANLLKWKSTSGFNYGDTVYDGTDYYLVADDVMLRGWPDATGPTI